MHLNISRDSFDAARHYLRVLQDQGGILLDADGNEQTAILLHHLHTLAQDLFGHAWGPSNPGFQISYDASAKDLKITQGHYYVEGRLAVANADCTFLTQPDLPTAQASDLAFPMGVYLDVWERHLTELEADIKDPGLEQLTGSTRTQQVWQVRVKTFPPDTTELAALVNLVTAQDTTHLSRRTKPELKARPVNVPQVPPTAGQAQCPASTVQRYAGLENQLYRVEVHSPGKAGASATFKWSRDNGAMIYAIAQMSWTKDDLNVTLQSAGLDDYSRLKIGDWVEYVDESVTLGYNPLEPHSALPLLHVSKIDALNPAAIVLSAKPVNHGDFPTSTGKRAFLRRRDQKSVALNAGQNPGPNTPAKSNVDNALVVKTPDNSDDLEADWFNLENGVQIRFEPSTETTTFPRGDYWLIPARIAPTGAVLWPTKEDLPLAVPAREIKHSYAPLRALFSQTSSQDCRRVVRSDLLTAPPPRPPAGPIALA